MAKKLIFWCLTSALALVIAFFAPLQYYSQNQTILLSFDTEPVDGPGSVLNLSNMLYEKNITATFFVTCRYAETYPEVIKTLLKQNHEIGCHTINHPNLKKLNYSRQYAEIIGCKRILENITNKTIAGFRAPYRSLNTTTLNILHTGGYLYDASSFENIPFYFPHSKDISEIKTSSYWFFTLSDYMMLYIFHTPHKFYFYLLKNKPGKKVSYAFHPHHIIKYKKEFNEFLTQKLKSNAKFITHKKYLSKGK